MTTLSIAGVAAVLSSCAVQQGSTASGRTVTLVQAVGASAPATSTSAGGGGGTTAGHGLLGGSVSYPDGMTIAMSKPARFQPSGTAAGFTRGHAGIKIVLTLVNGTHETYDPILTTVSLSFGDAAETAQAVLDPDRKVMCNFPQKVLPGRKATTACGFSVPAAGLHRLRAQVETSVSHDPAVFTGGL